MSSQRISFFLNIISKKYNHNSNQYKRHCCEPIQRYIFRTIKKFLSCFSVGNERCVASWYKGHRAERKSVMGTIESVLRLPTQGLESCV